LQVPHPHLAEREFFLRPMMELAPNWVHPVTGLTAAQMLDMLH
jgi:2-amino-4-hydroxy-6-hydroxymethyldihydropteridine diphosphokinase